MVTRPISPLVVECFHLAIGSWSPVTLSAFRFPDSGTVVHIVRSRLNRKVIKEILQDARAALPPAKKKNTLLLTVIVKCMSSGPSQGVWVGLKWQIHFNTPVSLNLHVSLSTLNSGRSSISSLPTTDHLFQAHVSASQPSNKTLRVPSNSLSYSTKHRISDPWAHINAWPDLTLWFFHQ